MSSNPTIYAAVAFTADRSTRTFWGEIANDTQVFTRTDAINPSDPNLVNHALLHVLLPALTIANRKPVRVILENEEQVNSFASWAATLFPEHRLKWLLANTPVTFSTPDKAEKKAFAAVQQKAENALAEHMIRQNQKAEQAAEIEREALRRLAEQQKAQADREATLAARHAAFLHEQDARTSERLAKEQAEAQQRAFDAAVSARMAQLAGGAR